ncbi:MAG TPA: ABC transporter permease [Ktedonobacteraceae bacterium]|nr:ABC transporter permease [Ktedonobacteraceae bacterium]
MFWHILHMESDKVFKRRLLWIGLTIAILPMIIAFIAFFNVDRSVSFSGYWVWPGGFTSALAFANGYSPGYGYAAYLLAVVVGLVNAQEYSWRTMQLWLGHGISRPLLVLAKFVTALVLVLLVTLAFLLTGGLVSLLLTFQLHSSADHNVLDVAQLLLSYLRTCYGLLPYVALTFLLVVVSRSAAVAISGVVLFMLAVELPLTALLPLLGKGYAQAAQFLPAGLANTMNQQNYAAAHLSTPTLLSTDHLSPAIAATCIAVYTLVLLGISLWIFERQNLSN